MKFDSPATTNPIDQLKIVGKPANRIDGPLKTTGTATYAYEQHEAAPNPAYGHVIGAAIGKGRIASMDLAAAKAAPGVRAIVTAANAGKLGKGERNAAKLLGGPEIEHYHQAVALVVAEDQIQVAESRRSDCSFGRGLLLHGIETLLRVQAGKFPAMAADDEPAALGRVVGAVDLVNAIEQHTIAADRRRVARPHDPDVLGSPSRRRDDSGDDDAESAMGQRHA